MNYYQDPDSMRLTEKQCSTFEIKHNLTLPNDYKDFLCSTVNGGKPQCEEPAISIPNWGTTLITTFFGVGANGNYNIEKNIWMLGTAELPERMIPIADDPAGNCFFLETSGENLGNVYFYFHEEEPNDPPTATNNPSLTLVAHSFNEFLDNIECIEST